MVLLKLAILLLLRLSNRLQAGHILVAKLQGTAYLLKLPTGFNHLLFLFLFLLLQLLSRLDEL